MLASLRLPSTAVAIALAIAVGLAACGDPGDDTSTEGSSGESSSTTTTAASSSTTTAAPSSTTSGEPSTSSTSTTPGTAGSSTSTTTSPDGPGITVTSPAPGTSLSVPFEVRGEANVFEATVQWEVLGPDGAVLESGFATAAAPGVGQWGPYTFSVGVGDFPAVEGPITVVVYELDPEEGSRQFVQELPLTLRA